MTVRRHPLRDGDHVSRRSTRYPVVLAGDERLDQDVRPRRDWSYAFLECGSNLLLAVWRLIAHTTTMIAVQRLKDSLGEPIGASHPDGVRQSAGL